MKESLPGVLRRLFIPLLVHDHILTFRDGGGGVDDKSEKTRKHFLLILKWVFYDY